MSAPVILAIRDRPDRARLSMGGDPDPRRTLSAADFDLDTGNFTTLLGYEDVQPLGQVPDYRWHVSIGGGDRVPAWNEFVAITHRLRPGVMFCMPLPPRSVWLNSNEFVLHAWELRDDNLVASWRANPSVKEPT